MKTTRRGFFGGMAGAAVAGPSLVQQAAAQALSGVSSGAFSQSGRISGSYGSAMTGSNLSTSAGHLDYLRTRIKQLRGMTADERRDEMQHMGWDFDLVEVATLRSVSDRQKMRMLAERRIERNRERELGRLLRELMGLEGRA